MELLECLKTLVDPRRPQGQLYPLAPLLFISVLAVLTGANSYRNIARFIDAHRPRLNDGLGLKWKRAPAPTAIRYAFLKLSPEAVEAVFRAHSAALAAESDPPRTASLSMARRSRAALMPWPTRERRKYSVRLLIPSSSSSALSRSRRSPTRSRPPSSSSKRWGCAGGSSPWMPSTVKKNLRGRPSDGQPSHRSSQR